jgi:hypothetical protein
MIMYAVGDVGIDMANTQDYGVAKATGAKFVFRYSAGAGNGQSQTQWKLCKTGEIAEITAAGLDFVANSEWYESRCTEGATAGHQDGAADLAFWQSRGLKEGSSIYISYDQSPNQALYGQIEAYLAAYNLELGGHYVADGFYAGTACLVALGQAGVIKHGWVPESTSWSGLPDWYYEPTPAQKAETMYGVAAKLAGSNLQSAIWQNGNHWFNNGADENFVVIAGNIGSHLEASGATGPTAAPPVTPAPPAQKAYQGMAVPNLIAQGTGRYFGSLSGPAASLGGANPTEKNFVKILQQRLIVCGFVPGHTNPNDGWADGTYDTPGDRPNTGATSQAVARFQHAHMPNTSYFGQCWFDDWETLFNL